MRDWGPHGAACRARLGGIGSMQNRKTVKVSAAAWRATLGGLRGLLDDLARDNAQLRKFSEGRAEVRAALKRICKGAKG